MMLPSAITLAICIFLGQTPSFTYAKIFEARQGPVDFQALKSAPLGRRNLKGLDLQHWSGRQHEHGSVNNDLFPGHGKTSPSYGKNSYDPSQGAYDSGKETYPSGDDKYGLGTGTFDLGTGTHHALQEGSLDSGNGGYAGSDPGVGPQPKAWGSYGSEKKSYDSEPEHASSEDAGKYYDSDDKPPATDNLKNSSGTDYSKQDNTQYSGQYASPNGKQQNGNDGTAKKSDPEGSFIFEPGTTEEQRKAAQKEGDKDSTYKARKKITDKGSDPYGGPVKPSGKKDNTGDQTYSQPQVSSGQKDENSSYS